MTSSEGLFNGLFLPGMCGFCTGYIWFAHRIYVVRAPDISGSRTGYIWFAHDIYAVRAPDICGSHGKQTIIA
ncbi:hypothetical protein [Bacteroides sp. UBA939]|uniref:hypothetical protein n=1 Tax=Bacteroides sp. UBA939 TaxID=1946092 RepID=UPI0025B91C76|nr:hypothetical protein [Bacteroides sp. UBA939]